MKNGYIVCVYESIKDNNALKDYAEKARSAVEQYGGKFLVSCLLYTSDAADD